MAKPSRSKTSSTPGSPTTTTKPSRATSRSKKGDGKMEAGPSTLEPSTLQNQNVQQYPQIQFVHIPYAVPTQHTTQPTVPTTPQAYAASASPPPSLETVFHETLQKLRDLELSLSSCQAATQRALVRHQHEQRKWQMHCVSFKQERDSARRQVMLLLQERAQLLGHQRSSSSSDTAARAAPAVAAGAEAEPASPSTSPSGHRLKAARDSRRHSPYSAPPAGSGGRRSSSPVLRSMSLNSSLSSSSSSSCSSSSVSRPPPRALSSPPSYSVEPSSPSSPPPPSLSDGPTPNGSPSLSLPPMVSSPTASPSSPPHSPSDDDSPFGEFEFATFDPLHTPGDLTAFEVCVSAPEPIPHEHTDLGAAAQVRKRKRNGTPTATIKAAPHLGDEAEAGSDMELESDDEVMEDADAESAREVMARAVSIDALRKQQEQREAVVVAEPSIAMHHLDLLYAPSQGKLRCRTCMLQRSSIGAVGDTDVFLAAPCFETDSSWEDLRDHALNTHPQECRRLARLDLEDLSYLRLRGARESAF